MSILYSGGLWTVFLILGVSFGYIWALNGPKWGYWVLTFLAVLIIGASQLLPLSHAFRVRIGEGLHWWLWAAAIAIPVIAYAMLIRWIKRKAYARDDT